MKTLKLIEKTKTKEEKFEEIECPICNSKDYEILSKNGEFDIEINASICKKCGLLYLNPRWDEKSYSNFYKNKYDKLYRNSIFNENAKGKRFGNNCAIEMCKILGRNNISIEGYDSFLDIGSGMGWFLEYFKSNLNKSDLYAIEASPHCVNNLKKLGIQVITEDVNTSWNNTDYEGFFDLIIMREVIEHLLDPLEVLKKISSVLSDKSLVYISTPNSMNPGLPLTKHFFKAVHTFYFSESSLKNLIFLSGMKPLVIEERGGSLYAICCN